MRRYLSPAAIVFALSLLASVAVHIPIYEVLGVLADVFEVRENANKRPPMSMEFEVVDEAEPSNEPEAQPPPTPQEQREKRAVEKTQKIQKTRTAEKRRPVKLIPAERTPPPPNQQQIMSKHAITQRSRDPNVEPPPNARYIAKENQRVEEETVARIRNYQRDDPEPQAASRLGAEEESESGDATETSVADLREMRGSDERTPTEEEARAPRPEESRPTPLAGTSERPTPPRSGERGQRDVVRGQAASQPEAPPQQGGGETAPTEQVIVNDGMGRFAVTVRREQPRRPEGQGPGNLGGVGEASNPRRAPRLLTEGDPRGGPAGAQISWSRLSEIYGPERLRDEREQYLRERMSKRQGSNRAEQWRAFRGAIENFVPNVRPGNQTALNAAASPFAEYLTAVHRRIHREFAEGFLTSLPSGGLSPYADRSLYTKLEIILNRDGSVHRIGVVQTSGFLPYDYGAFAAVMRAQPFASAPSNILSGDGRVYFHWGFYRDERQCGTFNAEPYILPNPPGSPQRRSSPLRDRPEYGGVIPRGATPAGYQGTPERNPANGRPPAEGAPAGPQQQEEPQPEETPAPNEPERAPPLTGGAALG